MILIGLHQAKSLFNLFFDKLNVKNNMRTRDFLVSKVFGGCSCLYAYSTVMSGWNGPVFPVTKTMPEE